MSIQRPQSAGAVAVSFEFFPPADAEMEQTLWQSVNDSRRLRPRFVSVTYGADGSTRERTHTWSRASSTRPASRGAPHLTCVGASRGEVLEIAARLLAAGVRHIVALRGDPRRARARYRRIRTGSPMPRIWCAGLQSVADFDISVAAYPEVHPEAHSAQVRSGQSQAQDRRGRLARDHAVLL